MKRGWGTEPTLRGRLPLRSRANLPQESRKIKINPPCRNRSGFQVVLVEGAAGNLNLFARSLDARKRAFMHGFKTPFHCDQICGVSEVPNGVYITGKRGHDWVHEVISYGCLAFECPSRDVEYDVIREVCENFVLIGASPGIEVLLHKRANVFRRRVDSYSLHIGSILGVAICLAVEQVYTRVQSTNS